MRAACTEHPSTQTPPQKSSFDDTQATHLIICANCVEQNAQHCLRTDFEESVKKKPERCLIVCLK